MSFDEQPDGDPHGECAAEIHRLEQQRNELLAAAQAVIDRWETPLWKGVPATAEYIYALRDVVDKVQK